MNEIRVDTPLGELRLIGDEQALAAICFSGQAWEYAAATTLASTPPLVVAADWVAAYFAQAGAPDAPEPPRRALGTPFQQQVWSALCVIGRGQGSQYGVLANGVGKPSAARAVGAAVGRNPWSLLVPCHRVLGASGALTGYAGGLGRKRALLALERAEPLPWQPALKAYRSQYQQAMTLRPGALVRWQVRDDDGEFPGWSFALDDSGRGAWVPRSWFRGDDQRGQARRSYSSRELDVGAGESILELDRFGGWSWVRHVDGRDGWIPSAVLSGTLL